MTKKISIHNAFKDFFISKLSNSRVEVKTRYSSKVAKAKIMQNKNEIKVEFEEPQRAITPGQSAVFYVGDIVLGGGKIAEIVEE